MGEVWVGLLVVLVLVQVAVVWSIRRHHDPALHIQCDSPIAELMPSLSGLTLGTAVEGNRVEVLENGRFFEVLLDRIGAARHSLHFETFLWKDGELGRRLADQLIEQGGDASAPGAAAGSEPDPELAARAERLASRLESLADALEREGSNP